MLARTEWERPTLLLPPLHRVPVRAGNIVEITGPSPSAKTEILLQAAINCILPKEWNGIYFGGLGRMVAYMDLDCRFDILRLSHALKLRIMSACDHDTYWNLYEVSPKESFRVSHADPLDELFLSCMKRFFYIRCYNSSEFLAALKTLHPGLKNSSEGLGVSVHILIVDSIGAFHWNDRACLLLTKDDNAQLSRTFCRKTSSLENLTANVVEEINKIRELQPLLVIASKTSIFGVANPRNDANSKFLHKGPSDDLGRMKKLDGQALLYREYMSPVWQSFVTHKVHLGISDVVSSDGRTETFPTYVCEWIQPPVNIMDKFVVRNLGIFMVS